MKSYVLLLGLACTLFFASNCSAQGGVAAGQDPYVYHPAPPRPPGDFVQENQSAQSHPKRFDAVKARQDAQELARLAQKVPAEIDSVSKSIMPKDLGQDLKRIQKLAKHLREQLSP